MFKKAIEKFVRFVLSLLVAKRRRFAYVLIFIILLIPPLFNGYLQYQDAFREITQEAFSRRTSIAYLAATILKERLDRLIDVGLALATRVRFRQLVSDGKWDEAIQILTDVPKNFPFIDRILLADTDGTLMADIPHVPAVAGVNFAHRDWYKGVSQEWKPYISEIYKRAAEPQRNVIANATPIRAENGEVVGILVLQVSLDVLFDWSREIDIGDKGFVYFVDKNGTVAGHPKSTPQGEALNFSNLEVVQKVLRGEEGVETFFNPIEELEMLVAYEPIASYRWGALATQPTAVAFARRSNILQKILAFQGIALFLGSALIALILFVINKIANYHQREKIFLDSIGDGIIAIDRNWSITLFNHSAASLSGWSQEEAVGKPLREVVKFIRERDRSENIAFIENAIVYGKTEFMENNTLLVKKNGQEIYVGDSASPILDAAGNVLGAIIVFRDLSKEKAARELTSDFAYASHQLRTPITKALWNLESVLKDNNVEIMRQNIRIAYESMKSMEKLAEELLEVSEADQKTIIPRPELVKFIDLFDEVLKLLEEKSRSREVAIEATPVSAFAALTTDRKLLARVLEEILENAVIYSPPKSSASIEVAMQENGILIEIRDSGIGIPENQQTLVFTKFFRASNIDTDKIIGAGLGLFIAREYVKLLKGKIWFKSEKDKGTVFSIFLPQSS